MKFLKTFLFTISLTFISFGVVTLKGFCQVAPELVPDSTGFSVIQGGGMPYYYSMNGFNEMWFMTPEFNQSINDYGSAVDNYMEQNFGYDVEHSYNLGVNGSVFVDGGSLDSATANWLANKMTQGTLSAAALAQNGYAVFSHNAQQWGQNAKEWFIGKLDSATNKITEVQDNIVTKFTSQGIANYLSMYSDLEQNGDIVNLSDLGYMFGRDFQFTDNTNHYFVNLHCSNKTLFVNMPDYNTKYLFFPNGHSPNPCSGFVIDTTSGVKRDITSVSVGRYNSSLNFGGVYTSFESITINAQGGINFVPVLETNSDNLSTFDLSLFGDNVLANAVNITSSKSNDILTLLNRLIGLYVDNNTMNRIVEVIREVPMEYQNGVPIANPSAEQIETIDSIIDDAVDYSAYYEELLEPLEESEPLPDPEPTPNNQGTEVPEDFPIVIFSPINDSIGSVFDFVSIFEPLFYIFSFSTGLLGLWLVVPFVILFLILFRLLK